MKVREARICLDCDEVHAEDKCPRCLNRYSVYLKDYFEPLNKREEEWFLRRREINPYSPFTVK